MRISTFLLSSIIILLSSMARAEDRATEVLGGALTQHFTDFGGVSRVFDNKVSKDGTLIANPMIAYREVEYTGLGYSSRAAFGGQNSIGELMGGAAFSVGVKVDYVRIGLVAGGYLQDDKKFRDRNVQPFTIPLGRYGLAPLAGVEFQTDLPITHNKYLTLYTIVTPVLATAVIGFGWTP